MIYVVATFGFISGFALGMGIISALTRKYSGEELLTNKGLKWKYGAIVWVSAFAASASAVWLYQEYYL